MTSPSLLAPSARIKEVNAMAVVYDVPFVKQTFMFKTVVCEYLLLVYPSIYYWTSVFHKSFSCTYISKNSMESLYLLPDVIDFYRKRNCKLFMKTILGDGTWKQWNSCVLLVNSTLENNLHTKAYHQIILDALKPLNTALFSA